MGKPFPILRHSPVIHRSNAFAFAAPHDGVGWVRSADLDSDVQLVR